MSQPGAPTGGASRSADREVPLSLDTRIASDSFISSDAPVCLATVGVSGQMRRPFDSSANLAAVGVSGRTERRPTPRRFFSSSRLLVGRLVWWQVGGGLACCACGGLWAARLRVGWGIAAGRLGFACGGLLVAPVRVSSGW